MPLSECPLKFLVIVHLQQNNAEIGI